MVPPSPARPTPAPAARVRLLLARASRERDTERFWTLAVALQLIEDHLAALYDRAALACGPPHQRRARRAQAAWKARLRDVATLLDR